MFDFNDSAGKWFLVACMAVLGIRELYRKFASSNPETVEVVKTKAEAKAIDLINRILK
jgi:hypothetical protein